MGDLIQFLSEQIQSNQFFQGGLIMGVAVAFWAWIRGWPTIIWNWIKYHTTVVLDIPDTDPAFRWVNEWLAGHHYSKKRARRLTVTTKKDGEGDTIILSPAPGRHWIWHQKRLLILNRERNTQTDQSGLGGRRLPFMETFTIRVLGRKRAPAIKLIADACEFTQPASDELEIHNSTYDGYWNLLTKRKTRTPESVILEGGILPILNDVQSFLDNRTWYAERGVPYRRGYLLHGSPGNGKTSLIVALASHFHFNLGYISLMHDRFEDRDLMGSLANIPAQMLIVIEDIDCIFREQVSETSGITFSGFLNALDGVASPEGHILVMTTNHRDRLDPALIRPGRVDMEVEFRDATAMQATAMFRRFYPGADGIEFGRNLPSNISMAALQGHLIAHKDDPKAAFLSLPALGNINESQEREE